MLYVEFFTQSAKHQFSADNIYKYFSYFPQESFDISFKLSGDNLHNLHEMSNCFVCFFLEKNKKSVNMLSTEIAQAAKHQFSADDILKYFFPGNRI